MKTQHTPGPWHIEKLSAPVYGSDGSLVAAGTGIGAGSQHIGTLSGKNQANDARLIAAAPALLAALSECLARLETDWPDERDGRESSPRTPGLIRETKAWARTVIAQAAGEGK